MNVNDSDGAVARLVGELARSEVRLRLVDGDRIEVSAPKGRLTPALRESMARHKPELLRWLARAREAASADAVDLPTVTADEKRLYEPFAPSDLQQSFLIGSRPGFEFHVRPHQYGEFEFDELDPARFTAAFNRAVWRQRRNLVVAREDMLVETVRDPAPVQVTVTDLRGLPPAEAERRMLETRQLMERQEPPHDRWPWMEPRLSLYGEGRARFHYNNNNLFADAPSAFRLLTDTMHYYHHPEQELAELEVSFRDCVLALAELEESPLGEASRKYWCDRMADWPDAPELPLAAGSGRQQRSRLSRRDLHFPPEQLKALRARADARGLTLTNVLLGAHAEVIAYWSGSRHFLLNNMITHRLPIHPQMREILGNFASLYPLEVDWRHDEGFTDRVRRLQARVLADAEHVYWSGSKVLQTLNQVRRTPGRAVCPFAVGSALFVGPADPPSYSLLETPQTLLDTEFWELRDGRLWVIWDVIESMFPEGLIDAMLDGYRSLVHRLAEDEDAWDARAFELLPEGQRERRELVNRAAADAPPAPDGLLYECLAPADAGRADRTAVAGVRSSLSYREVGEMSRRVAGRLQECGVRPGDRVAVLLPKGPEQMVAVLGVLTAGGVYVPVDPEWPADRVRYVLRDTAAAAVVTVGALRGAVPVEVPVVAVEDGGPALSDDVVRDPRDPAYIIYTSGSTGRPKGAVLDHRGPLNTVTDINRRFGIGPDDVVFGVSSLCFDLSVYDVFGTLAAGATLVLPDAPGTGPADWVEQVRSAGVTVWNSVPAVMQLFAEEAASAGVTFPALRTVLLSGDWIPVDLPDRVRRIAPNARVISLGGATEASIWSICFPVERRDPAWPSIPYGRPLAHQPWYVLDDQGRDVPTWVAGDLYIGGAGLALGYWGDRTKTDAAFVTHPRTGERLYRTGDRGRYLPSGDIEFLGRSDSQVKVQGFRVELGEIEHALAEHPAVRRAAVVTRASGSGTQLAAFVVCEREERRPDAELAEELTAATARRLPAYMVPGRISRLDRLPLTANGKLDRRALEAIRPSDDDTAREYVAPRTPVESLLAGAWAEILDVARVGVHDDFFDLGGQSFAALRLIRRIAREYGLRVPLGTLLERRTVAGLAAHLESADDGPSPLVRLSGPEPAQDRGVSPCFLVHPAGGNVLCYRDLSGLLGGPVYAFQAPGPASGQRVLESVEEMAALYVAALTEVRPAGPYLLGGWSSGGVIAFEMARLLEARGERVARVVVIDSPAPAEPRELDDARLLLWFLEDLGIGFTPGLVPEEAVRGLAGLADAERLARTLELARAAGLPDSAADPSDLAAALAVFRGVVRGCNAYRAGRIDAPLTVLRARDGAVSEFAGHPAADAPDWGWSAYTRGGVLPVPVSGTHYTLLTDPRALDTVAGALNDR
ncbi:amino acid adenylation domain-containing protein [Streptomyces sp. NPDC018693]|uniref:non-ribosomal peptide synthetase n=1 Tax=unclassified Streptomyces TaxID=2593676 RepID=UPI00379AD684